MSVSAESALCTSCGLCCDGSIFRAAIVLPEEVEAMRTLGMDMHVRPDGRAFALPCVRLAGKCCGIYPQRPTVCRTFTCRLLANCRAGNVTFARAEAIVAVALDLKTRAADATVASEQAGDAPASARSRAQAKLQTVAFDLYIEEHFRKRKLNAVEGDDRVDRRPVP